jgi:hypothetical protein
MGKIYISFILIPHEHGIATCWSDSRLGFGLEIGFIVHFYNSTRNYNQLQRHR